MNNLKLGKYSLSFNKPRIMGILNITPDSFSDGNKFLNIDDALFQVEKMISQGVDIIDIGGESSRPGAIILNSSEELNRISEITEETIKRFDIPVSIDTYKGSVAKEVLKIGASMINDIYGLTYSPEIADECTKYDAGLCIMHMRGNPKNMQTNTIYNNIIDEVHSFLIEQANYAISRGLNKNNICLDPGVGFGKDLQGNLKLISKYSSIAKEAGFPVLMGLSRKSFIGKILNNQPNERLSATIASNIQAYLDGCRLFRVHDVKEHKDALAIMDAFM